MSLKTARPTPVGTLIDQLWAVREKKRAIDAQLKEVVAEIDELEEQLSARLQSEGLDKASGARATAYISTTTTASVQDWDQLWAFILKNKYTHLLQRRVSDPAYRELLEAGKKVPGVQPFLKRTLNIRTV